MELLLILILWLISPVILGIICIVQHRKIYHLKNEKYNLEKELERLVHPESKGYAPQQNVPAPPPAQNIPETPPAQNIPAAFPAQAIPEAPHPSGYSQYYSSQALTREQTYKAPPEYSKLEQPKQAPDIRNINIVLGLGAMLVILSGYVFAAAAWGVLSPLFKSVVLLSVSGIFFGIHEIMRRKEAPENISKTFFILGSLFLPAAAAAGAVLQVFGEYLSFSGEGRLIVLAVMSAMLSGCMAVGAKRFDSPAAGKTAFSALTLTVVFLTLHLTEGAAAALVLSVYTILWTIAQPRMNLKCFALQLGADFIASANIWVLGIVSLFLTGEGLFILPALIFSTAFFITSLREQSSQAEIFAAAAYLIAGSLFSARPHSFEEFILTGSLTLFVITVVSLPEAVPERIRRTMSVISGILGITAMTVGQLFRLGTLYSPDDSPLLMISALSIFIQTVILALRRKTTLIKTASAAAFIWAALEASLTLHPLEGIYFMNTDSGCGLFFSALLLLLTLVTRFIPSIKKALYTRPGELLTCAVTGIAMLSCPGAPLHYGFMLWLIFAASAFISENVFLAPFSMFMSVLPLFAWQNRDISHSEFPIAIIIYCIAGIICTVSRKRPGIVGGFSMGLPIMTAIWLISGLFHPGRFSPIAIIFITLFSLANLMQHRGSRAYGEFFLTVLCLVPLDIFRQFYDSPNTLIASAAVIMGIFIISRIFRSTADISADNAGDTLTAPPEMTVSRLPLISPETSENFLLWAMPAISLLMTIFAWQDSSMPLIISSWIITFSFAAIARRGRRGLLMYACMPWAVLGMYNVMCDTWQEIFYRSFLRLPSPEIITLIFCVLLCITGRIFRREKPVDIKNCGDYFALSALIVTVIVPAAPSEDGYGYGFWFKLLTAAIIILNFTRRESPPRTDCRLFTIAALLGAALWNCQPFFTLPEIIRTEYDLLPAAAFCYILGKIYGKTDRVRHISQVISALCLGILFIDAAGTGYPADAVILGAVSLALLGMGFAGQQRGYFLIGAVSLTAETLLLTLRLGSSSAWWAYLLIAGVLLITAGTIADMHRRGKDGIWSFLFKRKSAEDASSNEE